MRRLGLIAFFAATGCFNPEDPEAGQTDGSSEGSSGETNPTTGTSATTPGSSTTATSTTGPSTTDGPTSVTGDTEDTSADTSTTTAADSCDAEQVCVESAPRGWSGPGLRVTNESGPPPMCGANYPLSGASGFTGAAGGPAECVCSCDFPADLQCEEAHIVYYDGEVCAQGQGANDIANGDCGTFFIGQGINSVTAQGVAPEGVSCTPSLDETIPPVGPTDPTAVCLPESFGTSCGEVSTCLPAAENLNTYCIAQEGDVPCPADSAYDDRTVLYSDFTDSRGCDDCSCGGADVECNGFMRAYEGNNCGGTFMQFPIDNACVAVTNDAMNNARYFAADATGGCPASEGAPLGEITPELPTTLCCADF